MAALRFFYVKTLRRPWSIADTPYSKKTHRLPTILSREEVAQLIDAARTPCECILLMTLYATGARNSELTHLKISDIDSPRMVVHIRGGEGRTLKWSCDADRVKHITTEVNGELVAVLNDQRERLDAINPGLPGPDRRVQARELGVPCALAKGAKDRRLVPNQIYVPKSEFRRVSGGIRIPILKATLPVPVGVEVKAITFKPNDEAFPTGRG